MTKYVIYRCKNGWLLNVYKGKTTSSEIYTDLMRVLARIADREGELYEEETTKSDPS